MSMIKLFYEHNVIEEETHVKLFITFCQKTDSKQELS